MKSTLWGAENEGLDISKPAKRGVSSTEFEDKRAAGWQVFMDNVKSWPCRVLDAFPARQKRFKSGHANFKAENGLDVEIDIYYPFIYIIYDYISLIRLAISYMALPHDIDLIFMYIQSLLPIYKIYIYIIKVHMDVKRCAWTRSLCRT